MTRLLTCTLLVATLVACGNPIVVAERGATVNAGGVTLEIPPNALDHDALVTLTVGEASNESDLLLPVSKQVSVDLGGAILKAPATLTVRLERDVDADGVVWLERGFDAERGGTSLRAHAVVLDASARTVKGAVLRSGDFSAREVPSPDKAGVSEQPLEDGHSSLQVPFYWQAGFGWCVPTSMSATLNFFEPLPGRAPPQGRYSNTFLAGNSHQDAASGYWSERVLRDLGVPDRMFETLRWEADLIPANPFTRYVRQWNAGFTSPEGARWAPRPVQTESDRNAHAFIITGSNADYAWFNNSNDIPEGLHPSGSWTGFRDGNCLMPAGRSADAGCPGDPNEELTTVIIKQTPRPEAQRRGSLFLVPGDRAEGNALVFTDNHDRAFARYTWDGDPYPNGYYFEGGLRTGALPGTLASDAEFGLLIPRTARAQLSARVMNLTNEPWRYRFDVGLFVGSSETAAHTVSQMLVVEPNRQAKVDARFPELETWLAGLPSPVNASFRLALYQNDVLQDVKTIAFHAGEAVMNQHPEVRITAPAAGVVVHAGVPTGFVGDAVDFEDGTHVSMQWRYSLTGAMASPVVAGTGRTANITFPEAGRYTVIFSATDSAGVSSYEQLEVVVDNPPPEPHIDGPAVTIYAGTPTPFSGYALDVNEPGGRVDCASLRWAVAPPDVVSPATGCDVQITFAGAGSRQVWLNADDRYGLLGATVQSFVVSPAPVNPPPVITALHIRRSDGSEVTAGGIVNDTFDVPLALSVSATDSDLLSYQWLLHSDAGTFTLGYTQTLSFAPRSYFIAPTFLRKTLTVEVRVWDGASTSASSRSFVWELPPP